MIFAALVLERLLNDIISPIMYRTLPARIGEKTDQGASFGNRGGNACRRIITPVRTHASVCMVSLNHMPSPKTRFGPTHTNVTRGAGGRLRYQVICRDAANNVGRGEGCCDVSLCQTEVTQIHSLGQLGTLDYHIYVLAGSLLFRYYQ